MAEFEKSYSIENCIREMADQAQSHNDNPMLIEQQIISAYSAKKDELQKGFKLRRKQIKKILSASLKGADKPNLEATFTYQSQFHIKFLVEYLDTHNFKAWSEKCNRYQGEGTERDICHFMPRIMDLDSNQ